MKNKMMDVENVGIMQGFLNQVGEEEDELEEEEGSEESSSARILNRRPDSPEILMNNLRGDMRSIDARREELADLVGYDAAAETPETVLAMLQPVLAQQGGLGALPQSSDMAQGPQAPMPPPSGGDMGVPPPGAPPLPPGGPPPPAGGDMAALLAAAGPPPGGGMAPGGMMPGGPPPGAGPMIGPDGQPIPPEGMPPIQMYRGGEVQHFVDGSPDPDGEEDDETQKDDLTGYGAQGGASFPPEFAGLLKGPGDLRAAVKEKEGIYGELLGEDKKASQAQLLFALAQTGLQFAGNVDAQGRPLRGSFASRLAGATAGLPGQINQFIADKDKNSRAVRMAAIESVERERSAEAKAQVDMFGDMLRASTAASKNRAPRTFGTGGIGPFLEFMHAPGVYDAYVNGQLNPDQVRFFEEGAKRVIADGRPRTEESINARGQTITKKIPGTDTSLWENALALRNENIQLGNLSELGGLPPSSTVPVGPDTTSPGLAVAGGPTEIPVGTSGPTDGTPRPEDRRLPTPRTIWDMTSNVSFLKLAQAYFGANVPMAGTVASQGQRDVSYVKGAIGELIKAFQQNPRFPEGEREALADDLDFKPSIFSDENALRNKIRGLDRLLYERRTSAEAAWNDPKTPGAYAQYSFELSKAIKEFRQRFVPWASLGVAVDVNSVEEAEALPAGTPFFFKNDQQWRVRQ